ncbi:MAG: methyl-accepting chemotaxis protein [Deltaproteobacteria bacterium]
MKNRTFKGKLILIFTTLIFVVCTLIYIASLLQLINIQKSDALERLETISELGYSYLDLTYKGEWRLDGEKLYKGDTLLNQNYKVVDEIKNKTGAFITIFAKDKRIATNVLKADGTRAIGTTISPNVSEVLLKKGEEYKGIASVLEKKCESIYKPLKNINGEVVGIWFVGLTQDSIKEKINDNITRFNATVILIIFVCIFLSIIAAAFFTRKIVYGVRNILGAMKNVEENGDLTTVVNIRNRDEIGDVAKGLNNMLSKQNTIFKQVSESSAMVLSSSQLMSAITENIDKLSQQQYSSVKETRNSVEELDEGMKNISDGIQEVTHSASEVVKLLDNMEKEVEEISISILQLNNEALNTIAASEEGKNAVERSKTGMDIINSSVGNLIEIVNELGQSASFIGEIVNVIEDISEQTNLLALNAAIEAARAGEHGRGFSIVAEAISNLAEKSSDATKEIEKLIKSIQDKLKQAVEASKFGAVEIEKGVKVTGETDKAFLKIKESADNVETEVKKAAVKADEQVRSIRKAVKFSEKVSELATSMSEIVAKQSVASNEAVKAIENINSSANNIASGTGEIASSSDSLAKESQKLASIISEFKLN